MIIHFWGWVALSTLAGYGLCLWCISPFQRKPEQRTGGGLSLDSILYRSGQVPDDLDGHKERSRSAFHGWH